VPNAKRRVYRITKGLVYLNLEDDLEVDQRCWIEPLDSYLIEIGDIVTGDLWSLGKGDLHNITKGYTMRVFVRGHT
jgi:hypothetical protein